MNQRLDPAARADLGDELLADIQSGHLPSHPLQGLSGNAAARRDIEQSTASGLTLEHRERRAEPRLPRLERMVGEDLAVEAGELRGQRAPPLADRRATARSS